MNVSSCGQHPTHRMKQNWIFLFAVIWLGGCSLAPKPFDGSQKIQPEDFEASGIVFASNGKPAARTRVFGSLLYWACNTVACTANGVVKRRLETFTDSDGRFRFYIRQFEYSVAGIDLNAGSPEAGYSETLAVRSGPVGGSKGELVLRLLPVAPRMRHTDSSKIIQ